MCWKDSPTALAILNIVKQAFQPLVRVSKVTIEVIRESLHFSAAHFTIFSKTERENLHGHNFRLNGVFESEINAEGLCFDYGDIKKILQNICDELDERFLVPRNSPHLNIREDEGTVSIEFNGETMVLPTHDVYLLPIRNITVEELANWIAMRLEVEENFQGLNIHRMEIRVASGSGQWGVVTREMGCAP